MNTETKSKQTTYHWKDGTELIVTAKGFDVYDAEGRHQFGAKEK
jgi:hypothetical protein